MPNENETTQTRTEAQPAIDHRALIPAAFKLGGVPNYLEHTEYMEYKDVWHYFAKPYTHNPDTGEILNALELAKRLEGCERKASVYKQTATTGQEGMPIVQEEEKKDNNFQHSIRITDLLYRFAPVIADEPDTIELALLHDFSDPNRRQKLGIEESEDLIQKHWTSLKALEELEKIGEQIRMPELQSERGNDPLEPTIINPGELLEFINKCNLSEEEAIRVFTIKALEVLDNLKHPIPEALDPHGIEKAFKAMQQDAIEAMYLYIPLMELLGQQEILTVLKDHAVPFLSREFQQLFNEARDIGISLAPYEVEEDFHSELATLAEHLTNLGYTNINYAAIEQIVFNQIQEARPYEEFKTNTILMMQNTLPEKFFSVRKIRKKGFGSSFLKALKYMRELYPDKAQIPINNFIDGILTTDQLKNHFVYIFNNMPDAYGAKIIGSGGLSTELNPDYYDSEGQEKPADTFMRQVQGFFNESIFSVSENKYIHTRVNADLNELKNKAEPGESKYMCLHTAFQRESMPCAFEIQTQSILRWLDSKFGPWHHFFYKFANQNNGKLEKQALQEIIMYFTKLGVKLSRPYSAAATATA